MASSRHLALASLFVKLRVSVVLLWGLLCWCGFESREVGHKLQCVDLLVEIGGGFGDFPSLLDHVVASGEIPTLELLNTPLNVAVALSAIGHSLRGGVTGDFPGFFCCCVFVFAQAASHNIEFLLR